MMSFVCILKKYQNTLDKLLESKDIEIRLTKICKELESKK